MNQRVAKSNFYPFYQQRRRPIHHRQPGRGKRFYRLKSPEFFHDALAYESRRACVRFVADFRNAKATPTDTDH